MSVNRYENGCAYFHEEEREGLAKICRLAIHSRYEDFVVDGFNVLYNKKPVVYLSAAARPGLGQYLCNQVMRCKVDILKDWMFRSVMELFKEYRSISVAAVLFKEKRKNFFFI